MDFITEITVDPVSFFLTYIDLWNHHMIKYLSRKDQRNLFRAKVKNSDAIFPFRKRCYIPWCPCEIFGNEIFGCKHNASNEKILSEINRRYPEDVVTWTVFTFDINPDYYNCCEEGHPNIDSLLNNIYSDYKETLRYVLLPKKKKEESLCSKKAKLEKE